MISSCKTLSFALLVAAGACGGETVPAQAPAPTASGDSVANAPDAGPLAPSTPPMSSGKRSPCTLGADQECNEDPTISSLWGRCTELGVCECKPGFELSPRGRCQKAP